MLNFFRLLGLTGGIVVAAAGAGVGVRAELLVPLSVPLRRADGPGFAGQPAAHPARDRRCASIAGSAPKRARRRCRWINWSRIRSAECTGCLQCVAECPAAGALFLAAPRGRRVPAWAVAAGVRGAFPGHLRIRAVDADTGARTSRPGLLRTDPARQRVHSPVTRLGPADPLTATTAGRNGAPAPALQGKAASARRFRT